jgi:hypothetical protein
VFKTVAERLETRGALLRGGTTSMRRLAVHQE